MKKEGLLPINAEKKEFDDFQIVKWVETFFKLKTKNLKKKLSRTKDQTTYETENSNIK